MQDGLQQQRFDAILVEPTSRLWRSFTVSLLLHLVVLGSIPDVPGMVTGQGSIAGLPRIQLVVRLPQVVNLLAAATDPPASPSSTAPQETAPQTFSAAATSEPGISGQPEARQTSTEDGLPGPNADTTGPFGPWYYPARYLHRHVTPLHPIRPDYPEASQRIAGHVVILLFVNEHGGVDRHEILAAEPAGIFEGAVIEAFALHARYAPGLITGYPVRGQLRAEVLFMPGEIPTATFPLIDPSQTISR